MVGKLPDDKVQISVVVDKKAAEKIDEMAKIVGISRSKMARNLMYIGLDDINMLSSIGLLQTGVAVRNMHAYVKDFFAKRKDTKEQTNENPGL